MLNRRPTMDTNNLHIHQFHETIVPPTCQSSGYTVYSCDCGYAHKANFVPATAHSFQVTETVPATCTTPGSIRSVCSGCGAVSTQSTPVLNHDYGEWAVQVYPTCEAPGKRANQCRRCGTTVEETIAPLGHKCASGTARYANGRTSTPNSPPCRSNT